MRSLLKKVGATPLPASRLGIFTLLLFQFHRKLRHARTENFAGQLVRRVGRNVGRFLAGLRHHAAVAAQTVDALVIHRQFRQADPDHAKLHGQREKIMQRAQFVAARPAGNGEGRRDFVAPRAGIPFAAGGVGERLELRRRPAHVSRAAENNRIARVELGKDLVVLITAFRDILTADGDEISCHAGNGRRAYVNGFRELRCVTGAGEVDDRYSWHGVMDSWANR